MSELAPESVFYAGNRKVKISRVETAKGRNIQDWRFCPRCHYSAPADIPGSGYHDKTCPRCHTSQWGDESARTKMLKMTQVYAFTSAKDAQLDDTSDDREPAFFNKQMLIDFKPEDIQITWVLDDDDRPFGFEFIRSANFLEVNFGRRQGDEMHFDVAGQQLQRAGFPVCRECGSVQSRKAASGKVEAVHLKSCSFSKGPKPLPGGKEDSGIENCLYLYRHFSSEGLRILLPRLSTGGTEEQVNSFVAALQLGLKRKFGGKVDHLRVAQQSEPIGETDERRYFVVLYDSVPGGTGYLHELLSNVENMQSVFRISYDVMKGCDCYDNTMDGCYRCLLEYRNAYGMESTSKELALEMLKDIVEGDHQWVEGEESLSAVACNPWMDSELEARFPEALARFSGQGCVGSRKVRVYQDVVRGKHGYRLTIGDVGYEIEPQVDLGMPQGVQFASRPDFVLWPVAAGQKPVAIFLDGYQFHAGKIQEDLLKRQSLMHAGFVVWSLNWYDVNQVMGDKACDVPLATGMTSPEHNHAAVVALAKAAGVTHLAENLGKTTFELLMAFLVDRNPDALAKQALLFVLQCLPGASLADPSSREKVLDNLAGLPASFTDLQPDPLALAGSTVLRDDKSEAALQLDFLAGGDLLSNVDLRQAMVSLGYDRAGASDEMARYQWQRLWVLVNFIQFLPVTYAWTPKSKDDGSAAGLLWPSEQMSETDQGGFAEWYDELIDQSLADQLKAASVSWPEIPLVGDDVVDANGEVMGNAELVFEASRIAFLIDEQLQVKPLLEADGWTVVNEINALVETINNLESGV